MLFLPHTNTVILLELYCGTITEPGLPVVCFENLPSRKSSKVSTARRKILSPEEHKKKYCDHLVAISNDNEEKYGDAGHSCTCKTAGMTHRKRCRSMVWSLKA